MALAPAKLNLELSVRGLRPDGSHEIDSVMQAISLADRIEIEDAAAPSITVSGQPAPNGPDNLALRAAAAIGRSVSIRLDKRIPAGAGLGGGSSDAAAVLRTLASGHPDLMAIAATLGADVPFLIRGGRARATGRGEVLAALPHREAWFALAWPGFPVSTAAVYAAWDRVGGDGRNQLFRAACAVEPRLGEFSASLGSGWVMTGSGSAFFKEFAGRAQAETATRPLDCWTGVACALPGWDLGEPAQIQP